MAALARPGDRELTVRRFAELLDRLVLTPSRNAKLRLLADYFRSTPDPDRGIALAAITGDLDIPGVKPAMLRALVMERMDPVLFAYSYDYVGDLAETVSLVWPAAPDPERRNSELSLSDAVVALVNAGRVQGPSVFAGLLDRLEASSRFALIKRLANTDNRHKTGAKGRLRLGSNNLIAFLVISAALGMSNDDVGRTNVSDHLC